MSIDQAIRTLLAEFKANPRLRLGVWGIVGIVWFYGVLELRDGVARQGEAFRSANRSLARAQAIAGQPEWVSRLDEARAVQVGIESRLWRESTVGLAQATFHDWLSQVAQQAGLARPQLAVVVQEDGLAGAKDASGGDGGAARDTKGLWKINARLAFDFSPQGLYALLARIGGHDKSVVVESLVIRSTPSPRAELVLVAYFQKAASGPAVAGAEAQKGKGR